MRPNRSICLATETRQNAKVKEVVFLGMDKRAIWRLKAEFARHQNEALGPPPTGDQWSVAYFIGPKDEVRRSKCTIHPFKEDAGDDSGCFISQGA